MENENLENINPSTEPVINNGVQESAPEPDKPSASRARKTPKPMVEGINSPVSSPQPVVPPSVSFGTVPPKVTLTTQEEQLIGSGAAPRTNSALPKTVFDKIQTQKIILPSSQKKSGRGAIWTMLIALLAVCTVAGAMLWYSNGSPDGEISIFSLFPDKPEAQNPVVASPVSEVVPVSESPMPFPATTTPAVATGTPVITPSSTPITTPKDSSLKVTATPTGYLNVRSQPSLSGTLLTKVYPGETYIYTEIKGEWYNIVLPDGSRGWVNAQYVQKVQ